MNWIRKVLVGALVVVLAAACSPDVEIEDPPLPTAPPDVGLPTAVPPDSIQQGTWAIPFVYEFPEGTWGRGFHRYALRVDCPILAQASVAGEWHDFVVADDVTRISIPIYFRLGGLSTSTLGPPDVANINPEQRTIAIVTIIGITEEQAALAANSDECVVLVAWDGIGTEQLLPAEPFQP